MKGTNEMNEQSFFRTLVAQSTEAIAVIDADDQLIYLNSACRTLLGYEDASQELLLGRAWSNFGLAEVHSDTAPTLYSRAVAAGWQGKMRLQEHPDSWIWVQAYPLPGEAKVALIVNDVIEHQPLAQELPSSKAELASVVAVRTAELEQELLDYKRRERYFARELELLDALMNYLPDWIFFKDADSRIIRSSKTHAAVLGLDDPAEAIGKTDFDFFAESEAQQFFEEEQELMHSGEPVIGRVGPTTTQEGEISWRSETKIPMLDEEGEVTGLVGISRDVTSLKRAEAELRQHEEQLEELVAERTAELQVEIAERSRLEREARESLARRAQQVELSTEVAQEIAVITDLDELLNRVVVLVKEQFGYYHVQIFRHARGSQAMFVVAGYGSVGEEMMAAGHNLPYGKGVVGKAAATGEPVLASDVQANANWVPHPSLPETEGELAVPIRWRDEVLGVLDVQSNTAGALTDEDQLLLRGLAGQIASSIESTRLLENIRRSRRRYRDLYDQSPDCYFSLNADGTLVDINETGLRLLGYEYTDLVSKMRLPQLLIPSDRDTFRSNYMGVKESEAITNLEVTFQRQDGSTFPALVNARAVYDDEGHFQQIQTIARDITEFKVIQQERERALAEAQNLYHISQLLVAQEDLQTMLNKVNEAIVAGLSADRVIMIIFDLEAQRVRQYLISGPGAKHLADKVPFAELWEGLSGWVLRERKPALSPKGVPDPRESVRVQERRRKTKSGSILVTPLLYRGELVGTITAIRKMSEPDFTERDMNLLTAFAQHISAAVINRRLLAAAQERGQREQLLREISEEVRGSISVDAIMRTSVRELGKALGRPAFVRLGSADKLAGKPVGTKTTERNVSEGGE